MTTDAAHLPGKADTDGWRRMHPLTPLFQGFLFLVIIAGILIANLRDRFIQVFVGDSQSGSEIDSVSAAIVDQGLVLIVLGGALGIVLIIVLFAWLVWRVHTYRITAEAVETRMGLLVKKHRRAPLERIQSVNLQRSLMARAAGLTKIDVQTAGQGGKVELAYLSHRDAKMVRSQILRSASRARGDEDYGPAPHDDAPVLPATEQSLEDPGRPQLLTPTPHEAVSFDGSRYAPAEGAFAQRAQDIVDFDIDPSAGEGGTLLRVPVGRLALSIVLSWEMLAFVVIGGAAIVASFWQRGMLAVLIPLVIIGGSMMISQFNKGFNFSLSRSRDGVRVGSGLTSTNTDSIPFGRIHAIEATQPLGWRPFGWWRVRITTAGHSAAQAGQNPNQNVVLPVGREDDVLQVLETLLPGIGDSDTDRDRLRDGLVGRAPDYLRGGPKSGVLLLLAKRRSGVLLDTESGSDQAAEFAESGSDQMAEPAEQTAVGSAGERPRGRRAAQRDTPDHTTLRIRRGAFTRSFIVMPVVRAQSVQLRRSIAHRILGLAAIQAHTVLGPVVVTMRGLELEAARHFFDQLAATVVTVQSDDAVRARRSHGATHSRQAAPQTVPGYTPVDGSPQ